MLSLITRFRSIHPALVGALFPLVTAVADYVSIELLSELRQRESVVVTLVIVFPLLPVLALSILGFVGRNDPVPSEEDSLVDVGKAIVKNMGRFAVGAFSMALLPGVVFGGFDAAA